MRLLFVLAACLATFGCEGGGNSYTSAEVSRLNAALTDADRAQCRYESQVGAMNTRGGFLIQDAQAYNLNSMCLDGTHDGIRRRSSLTRPVFAERA